MIRLKILFPLFFICVILSNCDKKVGKAGIVYVPLNCDTITYNKNVKPIIDVNCAKSGCHVTGFANGDYTTYQGVYAKVANGTFKLRVFDSPGNPMPQDNGMLPSLELSVLQCWLNKGAPND